MLTDVLAREWTHYSADWWGSEELCWHLEGDPAPSAPDWCFIFHPPRTGSTILADLLSERTDCLILDEVGLLPLLGVLPATARLAGGPVVVSNTWRTIPATARAAREIAEGIRRAASGGVTRFGSKTPFPFYDARAADWFAAVFPGAPVLAPMRSTLDWLSSWHGLADKEWGVVPGGRGRTGGVARRRVDSDASLARPRSRAWLARRVARELPNARWSTSGTTRGRGSTGTACAGRLAGRERVPTRRFDRAMDGR